MNNRSRIIEHQSKLLGKSIITTIIGTEALSESFKYTLAVHADQPKDPLTLLGKTLTLNIKATAQSWHISGIITKVNKIDHGHGREIQYQVILESWLAALKNQSDCRIYQNLDAVEIIKKIIEPYPYCKMNDSKLTQSLNKLEYATQYNESSSDFIQRLLASQGINYYFQHSKDQHTMVLLDSGSSTPQYKEKLSVNQPNHSSSLAYLHPKAQVIADRFCRNQYNYLQPKANLNLKSEPINKRKKIFKQPLEQYHYPGDYLQQSQGEKELSQIATQQDQQATTYQSASQLPALHPALVISIEDAGKQSEAFLISEIKHHIIDHTGHIHSPHIGTITHEYKNTFRCLKQSKIPMPTPRPKPQMNNSQTATVIGHQSEDIHTDALARIKVRFHWDRYNNNNPDKAGWIRCKQKLADKQWGTLFLPRIGSEVIVDFMDNDPDQPIITGQVYNAINNTPFNTQHSYLNGIKSKTFQSTLKQDGNILQFNDKSDEEELWIHAQKDLHIIAENNFNSSIKQNESEKILAGNKNITVKNHYELTANTKISFKCGTSSITMDKSSINIFGEDIAIN